jgi:iron(III) transport system ATP-binding protein
VANFIGEADFIPGRVLTTDAGRATVQTEMGVFEGVRGDTTGAMPPGASVTLSIRPEAWSLGRDPAPTNVAAGRVGESIYLGEVAQHAFVTPGPTLKILELNPATQHAANGALFATVKPEDVVVLAN